MQTLVRDAIMPPAMTKTPAFASAGTQTGSINVHLSYRIIELFSEGLYASPNKAVEELVTNSFDAGAVRVLVLMPDDLQAQDASIVVIDDGEGMDSKGLTEHWLIGVSNKRRLSKLPRGRQQIGKFGIGKLATYVLAERLTHVSKRRGEYFSTSMDYSAIDTRVNQEVEPKTPIKLPLRTLTEVEAKAALAKWTDSPDFKAAKIPLFGKGAPESWTVAVMSSLKPKVHEIKPGILEWVLRTALPLRPDFEIWLNGNKLVPSKQGKGLIRRSTLGKKPLDHLSKPAPKNITAFEDTKVEKSSDHRFGLIVPGLGRVTGYAEVYRDLLTGKSDEIGRSYGFFVYVLGRLVNVVDGHFGISPNELRHGTFGRFRLVVYMDGLDAELRSNREAISEGPLLATAQDVLRAIFNAVRPTLEAHDAELEPGAALSRKIASTPASLSRHPIVTLAKAVLARKATSRYLTVPPGTRASQESFLTTLEQRASDAENFVTGLKIDYDGTPEGGLASYDIATGNLRINAWHPFVATFHDDFVGKAGQPLELFAMAEVLIEAHLHAFGMKQGQIDDFLSARDQLLRYLANESGRQSAFGVAQALREARNNPAELEDRLCAAFTSLGFEVTPIGGRGEPDGVATALISADQQGKARQYAVSLEAKSKKSDGKKVAAGTVDVAAVIRHRDAYKCTHALVVGPSFPKGDAMSALAQSIDDDRAKTKKLGDPKTITVITIDQLAQLVRLRPLKQLGLLPLKSFFEDCRTPEESAEWVAKLKAKVIKKPPYAKIVQTIERLQKKRAQMSVKYAALTNELSHLTPPIDYETEHEVHELCRTMAQMAPGAMFAGSETVELDQSAANVIAAIEAALHETPPDES
jgi:hypothetical protein